ncbi:MAG: family deacetylase [Myxococcaceae bacterium]|nr:family deacetylase [Myxococcaceae bacterium]
MSEAAYPWSRLRAKQYDEIYVSPHMDDAVYSCGGQIALERRAGKRILIITVFGDGKDEHTKAAGTKLGIFSDTEQRKREERAAVERLDVDHLWLNYPDLLVRPKRLGELFRYGLPFVTLAPSELCARLYAALSALVQGLLASEGRVFLPLGVGAHPDHRIVHAVGRALAARGPGSYLFYEDIPYAQVPALRAERLRQLGLVRPDRALEAAREVHAFVFAHAPSWQRPLTQGLTTLHTLVTRALFRVLGDKTPVVEERDLRERDIDAVIEDKVEAMRAYATQTAYFFPPGAAIYDVLTRAGERYVERYWRLGSAPAARPIEGGAYAEPERARVQALLASLPG